MGFYLPLPTAWAGMDLGEVASSTAISVVTEEFAKAQADTMLMGLMPRLIQHANAAVHDCRLAPEYRGKNMATTLVTCALRHDQAVVSHVGDSRCYLVRGGHARQVTQDHTWVNQQRKIGLISAERCGGVGVAARADPLAGAGDVCLAGYNRADPQPGDVLVLCTDGLHDEMGAEAIAEMVSQSKPAEEIARELVARAVEIDGNDNTTAQVIRVRAVEQVGMYRGRPYRLQS